MNNTSNNSNNGGGGGFFDFIFGPILKPLRDIIKGALLLVKFLVILVTKIPEILETAFTIFSPQKIINDIIVGMILGIQILIKSILNRLNISQYFRSALSSSSNTNCSGKKCYKLTPLSIVFTVICPPFGIFMKHGLEKWFELIICSLLTVYAYYFPGLLFAILMIQQ